MTTKPDHTGEVIHYFTVIGRERHGVDSWICKCVCGETRVKQGYFLRRGLAKSCGCKKREILRAFVSRHGRSQPGNEHFNTFYIWSTMLARCGNKKHKSYHRYGGRGISVCERWKQFENFLSDIGDVPPGMTIDRIDNNGDYSKENCRWASHKEQARNRSNNRLVSAFGRTQPLSAWAEEYRIPWDTLAWRIRAWGNAEESLTKPLKRQKNSRCHSVMDAYEQTDATANCCELDLLR
jgi:hypothetical protein